jgi:hypothetical protein
MSREPGAAPYCVVIRPNDAIRVVRDEDGGIVAIEAINGCAGGRSWDELTVRERFDALMRGVGPGPVTNLDFSE